MNKTHVNGISSTDYQIFLVVAEQEFDPKGVIKTRQLRLVFLAYTM